MQKIIDETTVQVGDKIFRRYIKKSDIDARITEIATEIDRDLAGENPLFVIILNGAFIFAADLYRAITIPSEITTTRLKSYSGTETTGAVKTIMPLQESVVDRTVVIIEDIVDSGLTIQKIIHQIKDLGAKDVRTAILLFKPDSCQIENPPIDYCAFKIPSKFIVGYGLDYDEAGRSFPDIYALADED